MERTATPAGIDPAFFDAEIERALEPYRALVSTEDLAFMRERLAGAIANGGLRDAARRAAPRVVDESVEAPLRPEEAELVRAHRAKETGSGG